MSVRTPSGFDVTVGQKIRARRLALGISQEALAEILGVTFQQLQKYEKGVNRVSAERLWDLANALDVPTAWLLPAQPNRKAAPETPTLLMQTHQGVAFLELYENAHTEDRPRLLSNCIALAEQFSDIRKVNKKGKRK